MKVNGGKLETVEEESVLEKNGRKEERIQGKKDRRVG